MSLNESIVEDAGLERFEEQTRCAPALTGALLSATSTGLRFPWGEECGLVGACGQGARFAPGDLSVAAASFNLWASV
jgi:hypothetical protein